MSPSAADVVARADLLLRVRISPPGTPSGDADLALTRSGQTVIAFLDPLGEPALAAALAARGVTALSMELMPRITRAQSMDALSSMATVAGYKAVLLAAGHLPRMFPMLTTAAGHHQARAGLRHRRRRRGAAGDRDGAAPWRARRGLRRAAGR